MFEKVESWKVIKDTPKGWSCTFFRGKWSEMTAYAKHLLLSSVDLSIVNAVEFGRIEGLNLAAQGSIYGVLAICDGNVATIRCERVTSVRSKETCVTAKEVADDLKKVESLGNFISYKRKDADVKTQRAYTYPLSDLLAKIT